MPSESDERLAKFLRATRGEQTRAAIARRLGVTESTLFRLENLQQSATLSLLDRILKRLHRTWADVFVEPPVAAVHESAARYDVKRRRRKTPGGPP